MKIKTIVVIGLLSAGWAQAIMVDVNSILTYSRAGDRVNFWTFQGIAWTQITATGIEDGPGRSYGGSVVDNMPGGGEAIASQGTVFASEPDWVLWTGNTFLKGADTLNLSVFSFTLFEPVTFLITSVFGTAELAGFGNSGLLKPGSYSFRYEDSLFQNSTAQGRYELSLSRVPEMGSTFMLLGMALCAIGAVANHFPKTA